MGYKQYWIYMLTNSLGARVWQHENKAVSGFTKKYNCDILVCFEEYDEVDQAIRREKQLKGWKRERKNALVTGMNPEWKDFAAGWYGDAQNPDRRVSS